MSWQDYISKQMIATGSVSEALIAGVDGTVWANSPRLQPKPEEVTAVITALEDGGESLRTDGIRVAGTRYIYLAGEPGTFVHCKRSTVGLYARRTQRVMIAALYDAPLTADQCAACVTNLCSYLQTKGF